MGHLDPRIQRLEFIRTGNELANLLHAVNTDPGADVDQHQRAEQVRVLCSKRHRVHAAHRVSQHDRTVESLRRNELANVRGHVVARVVAQLGRAVGVAVTALVQRIPMQLARKGRRDLIERVAIQREAVQRYRSDRGVAPVIDVVKIESVDPGCLPVCHWNPLVQSCLSQ